MIGVQGRKEESEREKEREEGRKEEEERRNERASARGKEEMRAKEGERGSDGEVNGERRK